MNEIQANTIKILQNIDISLKQVLNLEKDVKKERNIKKIKVDQDVIEKLLLKITKQVINNKLVLPVKPINLEKWLFLEAEKIKTGAYRNVDEQIENILLIREKILETIERLNKM